MANKVFLNKQILAPLIKLGWTIKVSRNDRAIFYATSPDGRFNGTIKFYFRSVSEQSRVQGKRHKLRMQVSKFTMNDSGKTALLGWSEKHNVFVAWDAFLHSRHGKQTMLSCYEETLSKASVEGYADGLRKNKTLGRQEKYISFDSEFLENYLLSLDEIFEIPAYEAQVDDEQDDDDLDSEGEEIGEEDFNLDEEDNFSEREEKKRLVSIKIRDYKFRKKLLEIYDHRCAICQTKVVDILQGAHVVPVSHDGTDLEDNGILLCANHHLMFDRNLIQIHGDYSLHTKDYLMDESWYKKLLEDNGGKIYLPIRKAPSLSNLNKRVEILGPL